ncbi:MAG: rRNA (cytosine967-C5)-methyltransferase [Halanaerobiales bacterium]|nr:rRNA (cytosine967-C5)-methyltransferase [Halanaerobiales bacterium]
MNTRRMAIRILQEIEEGAYSNLVLDRELKKVRDKRDRGLITELVYGVLRQQKRLDYLISQLSSRPLRKIEQPVLLALRLGIYQLEFLDRIPERAAVNETVNAIKGLVKRGGVGFTNGLLRGFIREREQFSYPDDPLLYLSTYYSHPEWMVRLWLERYGYDDTLRLLQVNNRQPDLNIRRNSLKVSTEEFLSGLEAAGVEVERSPISDSYTIRNLDNVESIPLFKEGGFMIQGAAAILTGHILSPEPGMRILDMAAAPGGKTTHLAQLMENKGEIVALDIYDHKLKLIQENCQRLGVKIVKTLKRDGSKFRCGDAFDMILVDAPCSGLGLVRQKPEIKWNKSPADLEKLPSIQLSMLNNALNLLKASGILLYSTCTLAWEENQGLVHKFIAANRERVELLDIGQDLKRLGLDGYLKTSPEGYLELFPPDSGTEGFFIAKFRKGNY